MPTQRITGTIKDFNQPRSQHHLFHQTMGIGAYVPLGRPGADRTTVQSSHLTLWIPSPTSPDHEAGVFLRLHNANSSAYARLTLNEITDISQWLAEHQEPMVPYYNQAVHRLSEIRKLDAALAREQQLLDPTVLEENSIEIT